MKTAFIAVGEDYAEDVQAVYIRPDIQVSGPDPTTKDLTDWIRGVTGGKPMDFRIRDGRLVIFVGEHAGTDD